MLLTVRVVPRSSRRAVLNFPDGSLKVWLRAAPADGKANEELREILSEHFKIAKSAVTITSGQTGRLKIVRIEN
jgi:uncharacterized protein (TIGR00251 family)